MNEAPTSQLQLSDVTLQAFGSRDISDWLFKIAQGLPKGLWNTEVTSELRELSFFRSSNSLKELFQALPSILVTLRPCMDVLDLPLVEGPSEDYSSEDYVAFISSKPELQKIRLPQGATDENEDILIERTYNSVRINFKFTTVHIELRTVLLAFLSKLHATLQGTFDLTPWRKRSCLCVDKENVSETEPRLVVPNLAGPPVSDRPNGIAGSVEYAMAWSECLRPASEMCDQDLADWLATAIIRKRPVPSYHLSLLILPIHTALLTETQLTDAIWRILSTIDETVNKSLRSVYAHCNMLGEAYHSAFEGDVSRAYVEDENEPVGAAEALSQHQMTTS